MPLRDRFTGTCEPLGPVDAGRAAGWLSTIPFEDWPQQTRLPDGKVRPAMVNDLGWRGFGEATDALVLGIMLTHFFGCASYQRMLSVVMPGHRIDPHSDQQEPDWLCRVHVPLATNPRSWFAVRGERHAMPAGSAYLFNTFAEHAVYNEGDAPRVHLMFDVRAR